MNVFSLLNLKTNTFISLLFFLALLSLPFQLGKHFWPSFSFVLGQRVDYLSPTLFISDIFIFCLFLFLAKKFVRNITKWFWIALLFFAIGIFLSQSPFAGWYGLFKIVEYTFFAWVIVQQRKNIEQYLFWTFSTGVIIEGALELLQFFRQSSANGLWYFLGERQFSASTPGIANATIHGQLILRPYATFPHPNVFAGYMVIVLIFFLAQVIYTDKKKIKTFSTSILILGTGMLFLTLSRVAILVWIVLLISALLIRFGKQRGVFISAAITLLVSSFFLIPLFSGRFLDSYSYMESLELRILLQNAALKMWLTHLVFGVGLNNFLIMLPSVISGHVLFGFLQPVHNIFLFVLSETGLGGIILFGILLGISFTNNLRIVRRTPDAVSLFAFLSLLAIVIIGLTDHYFLTLQQGQLLFALVIGLSFSHGTIPVWPFTKNSQHTRPIK